MAEPLEHVFQAYGGGKEEAGGLDGTVLRKEVLVRDERVMERWR
jgi:hypothetical protein